MIEIKAGTEIFVCTECKSEYFTDGNPEFDNSFSHKEHLSEFPTNVFKIKLDEHERNGLQVNYTVCSCCESILNNPVYHYQMHEKYICPECKKQYYLHSLAQVNEENGEVLLIVDRFCGGCFSSKILGKRVK